MYWEMSVDQTQIRGFSESHQTGQAGTLHNKSVCANSACVIATLWLTDATLGFHLCAVFGLLNLSCSEIFALQRVYTSE